MTSDIVIGREEEKKLLEELLYSGEAELIAIYGRRRVGKTYLIRNFYQKHLALNLQVFMRPRYVISCKTSALLCNRL